ncbi:MAG: pyridoxal phosphate-dependent aminotransferase [Wujia sp.]
MRNPLSSTITQIKPSGIRKFFDIVSEMPHAISLGVGEPDFDTPWHVRAEGIRSLEKGKTFYTSNSGLLELRKEICEWYARKYDVNYDYKSEALLTVGGSEGIDVALRAMVDPGDEVIIPEPCYVSYLPCVQMIGGVPVTINLKNENEFRLTKEELLDAITDKTKILILAFPSNPTGAVMTKKDLEPIAQICIEKDIFVISDEIYSELTYGEERHCSIASLPGMKERTIVINGFSKAYAMTGWRLGYALAPQIIAEQMTKIHQFAIMCAPTTSQYAAISAIKNGDNDIDRMRESYDQRRRFLLKKFEEIGLPCFEPKGAFYVFPCIKEFGISSDEFATKLLQEEELAVVPGTAFGDCGEGFLRISYAYSLEQLKEAMGRIERFIGRLRAEKNA